ncbi:hypothetical protein ACWEPN_24790 [Nonomuraea wenchangensis]
MQFGILGPLEVRPAGGPALAYWPARRVRRIQTGGTDQHIVDASGRTLAVIPGEFTGGDIEIRRGARCWTWPASRG